MSDPAAALRQAGGMLAGQEPEVWRIAGLSLALSVSATPGACLPALPPAPAPPGTRLRGRRLSDALPSPRPAGHCSNEEKRQRHACLSWFPFCPARQFHESSLVLNQRYPEAASSHRPLSSPRLLKVVSFPGVGAPRHMMVSFQA